MAPIDFTATRERFTGFGAHYDHVRPSAPEVLADLLAPIAGCERPRLVVDLGSGTGLSSRYWASCAEAVVGVEPTASMRDQAIAQGGGNITYREGYSHATGLAAECADLVVCGQSLHWMEPQSTFEESARILRPGGVFAAYDYDWPPSTSSWEVDAVYTDCVAHARRLEKEHAEPVLMWEKEGHLARMQTSGCFRYVRECLLHQRDEGHAERIVGLYLSQGHVQTLLKRGLSAQDLRVDYLTEVARRAFGEKRVPWFWSARIRLGVK